MREKFGVQPSTKFEGKPKLLDGLPVDFTRMASLSSIGLLPSMVLIVTFVRIVVADDVLWLMMTLSS